MIHINGWSDHLCRIWSLRVIYKAVYEVSYSAIQFLRSEIYLFLTNSGEWLISGIRNLGITNSNLKFFLLSTSDSQR